MEEHKLKPRHLIIKLTALLFSAYSAYYIFVIIRDYKVLTSTEVFISVLVALVFGALSAFAWTSGVKNIRFIILRRSAFIISIIILFALKLRMMNSVIGFFDISEFYTVMYAASYFMTQAAFVVLLFYYIVLLKRLPLVPKAHIIFPIVAMSFFAVGLILEMLLLFIYGVGLEANFLRSIVSRSVFYLSFIGLSANFMFPPKPIRLL